MDNQTDINNPVQNTPPDNLNPNNTFYSSAHNNNPGSYHNYNPNNYNHENSFMLQPVNLDSLSGWMKFFGIFTIVVGALTCIGIITAAIGVPMILAGIGLVNASKSLKEYKNFNNQFTLNDFFTHLNRFFKINGILAIIYIVIMVMYIAFLLIFILLSVYSFGY